MEIELFELKKMLLDSAELGAKIAINELGLAKSYLSQNKAWTKYGRGTVERWVRERLITPIKDGTTSSNFRFEKIELEAVAKASNRMSYEPVKQRI